MAKLEVGARVFVDEDLAHWSAGFIGTVVSINSGSAEYPVEVDIDEGPSFAYRESELRVLS